MNKKFIRNLTYIIASLVLLIGGIFTYSIINNKKIYFSEDDILLAAANYIEDNDIGIGEKLQIPVSLLKAYGFLDNDVICTNDSYITVKNVNGEYLYESNLSCNNITTITSNVVYMTANTINETINPQIPLAYKGPTYSITDRTNKNVTVTIVTNLDILDVAGWDKIDSKTISKTFSTNSNETITINAKNSINNSRQITININNIDKEAPIVTGVINGTTYTKDVSIGFEKVFNGSTVPVTAKLNGQKFENGQVVSKDGNYTLVVTDDIGNSKTVSFIVDKTAPEVTGIENGRHYNHDVTINFTEGTATLNGSPITSGYLITANKENEKEYKLVVTDSIGNKNEITFWIDVTGATILKDENGNITGISYSPSLINGKTSADTTVTITYNEEIKLAESSDWSVSATNSKQIYKQFNGESGIVTDISDTIQVNDLAGNTSETVDINFTIDKKAPEIVGEIEYSPALTGENVTNADTTVTITYNEAIKLLEESKWNIVEGSNNTKITRTFIGTENTETNVNENVVVMDLIGNPSVDTPLSFTIDKKAPEIVGEIEYSPELKNGRTETDTIVTISYSEAVKLPANWDYVVDTETGLVDNTKITRTFIGTENTETNVDENVMVTDLVGNVSSIKTINFTIDKKAPSITSITYIPDLINGNLSTQDVIVLVTYDEELKKAPENWQFASGTTNQITRTFTGENGKETTIDDSIVVEDLVGNVSSIKTINFTIDKKEPSITDINYSPVVENGKTKADTTVTITYDETLKVAPENWQFVSGTTNQITRIFIGEADKETVINDSVIVEDLYGNESVEQINFTIDKKKPEIVGEIEYSPALTGENVTNADTTVTITYNEEIKLAEGSKWTIIEESNNTKITRTFVGEENVDTNVGETVAITDLAGNTSIEKNINFTIDKKAPTGVVTANPNVPTKESVILTLETSEDVIITNLASSKVYQCEEGNNRKYCVERNENGKFSFKFKDLAGNTGRVSYNVTNIDKEAPERFGEIEYSPELKDGKTASDTTVTITYSEAIGSVTNGWTIVDENKITKTFIGTENIETIINETVYVTDLAGNAGSEETINFVIDKAAPIGAEIIADPTNDTPAKEVTLFLYPSEKIIITNKESDEVKLFDETVPVYMVTVKENGIFTFEFEDLVGNKGTASYNVTNIDKTAPTVQSIKYNGQEDYNFINGRTKEDITVTITYDEELKVAPENWKFVSGTTNEIARTFAGVENAETNVNEKVVVTDLVGNTSLETTINFTIDKKLPVVTGTIEYSPALKDGRAADDTTVTITYSEPISSVTNGWTIVDENKITKTFIGTENIETIINETVYVTDLAGNAGSEETINFVIDKAAPIGAEIIADPTNDTPAKEVTLFLYPSEKIIITNEESDGVKLFDETVPVYMVTVKENGIFTFEFEDLVGNKGTASYNVTNIDKTVPTVQSIKYNGQADYNFINGRTKEDIIVTIEYSEDIIIPNTITGWSYAKDENNNDIKSIITKTFNVVNGEEHSFSENIVVKDIVGNASAEAVIDFTIDKKAPVVKSNVQAVDVSGTKNVIVTITYDEALKVAPENWEFVSGTTNQITRTFEGVENAETPVTASVIVEDLVGNVSAETVISLTIDKKSPIMTNIDYSPSLINGRTSSDTTVTITYDEALKVAPAKWQFVSGTTNQITRTFVGEQNAETIAKDNVVVEDLYENASTEQAINFVIDKKVPIVSKVEYSPELTNEKLNITNKDTIVTITYNEAIKTLATGWSFVEGTDNKQITKTFTGALNSDTTINDSVSVTDLVGNPIVEPLNINFTIDKTIPTLTIYDSTGASHNTDFVDSLEYSKETFNGYRVETNDETATITHTGDIDLSQLGEQFITYTVKDKAGNEQSITINVTIVDTVLPTVNFNISDRLSQNNGWYNEPIVVNIDGSDIGSGISKYEYQYISDGLVKTGEITDLTEPKFTIDVDGRDISFVITAYDKANNKTQVSGNNYKLDTIKPTLDYTVQTNPSSSDNWYNTNISILVNGSDTLSGISKLEYSYSENNGLSWSEFIPLTTNNLVIDKESTGLINKIKVSDIAGNSEVYNIDGIYKLDKSKPVITVTDGKNTYTDNFTVKVQANRNGKYTLPTATVTDNFDKNIKLNDIVGSIDITKIGTYYVKYSATDQANNTKELTMTVEVVDTTAPTIKLNGDNPQLVNLGTTYVEQGVTIDDNLDTNLKVAISGDIVNTNKVGEYKVVYSVTDSHNNTTTVSRIVKVVSTTTSNLVQSANNCEAGKDCYITSGTNNYVWYSGFLWRIIKVNDDNTVKLITEDSVSGFSYDDDSSIFKDSNVNNWLSTEFYNSLNNKDIITNGNYCIDTLMTTREYKDENGTNTKTQEYAKANVRYNCNSTYSAKVGLLTIDEYNILGAENSYLNTGDHFFTMTPSTNQTVWVVQTDGIEKAWYRVNNTYAIRPVITISANAKISSGDGSINNPYRIESDKVAQSNDLINTRYTGEYVRFGNQNWRIVSTTDNATKLIMDNYYQTNTASKNYVVVANIAGSNYAALKFGENGLYKGSYVEDYLNNVVYNDLFTNREKAALVKSKWYNGSYSVGQNPLQSLSINNQYTESNIGLIRIGELMSGTSSTSRVDGFTYWTSSYVDNTTYGKYAWFVTWGGAINNALNRTDIRGLRPVINIKSNISIKSGTGTVNDPYILNY